jgi:DNA-binding NarL/FixJ family response regulator
LVRIAPDRANAPTWPSAAKDSTVTRLKFILIDSDRQRAATLSAGHARQRGVAVADSLADLAVSREGICVALVADEPEAIRATAERMKAAGLIAKIIAYADDASPHRIVKAMAAGAADFLHWPCNTANIVAAATAATASPVD